MVEFRSAHLAMMRPHVFHVLSVYVLATGVLFLQVNGQDQPAIITTKNNDYFGFMDRFNGFICEASGTKLKFNWKHQDLDINADYPLKFPRINSSTLQPNKDFLTIDYEGTYQCFAKNSIGTVFGRKATVKFTVVGDFVDPANGIKTKEAKTGKPFWLHCPSHKPSHNVKYKWEYQEADDHVTLPPSPRYFMTKNGTLYFSSISTSDINSINKLGGIHCQQRATVDGVQSAKISHRVKLKELLGAEIKSKPIIKTDLGTQNVFYGEDRVVLKCGAVGNPIPSLRWFKVEEHSGEKTEIVKGQPGYDLDRYNQFLSVLDVTINKAGDYLCVANNTEGKDETPGKIIVANRPQWTVTGALSDVQPAINNRFAWECQALGGATYAWYKDGRLMSSSAVQTGKYVIQHLPEKSRLIFKEISEENNGMYQCTAGNEKDIIYSTGRLQAKIKAPEFIEAMGPLTLVRMAEGIIFCPVDAAPLPKVIWKKDNLRISFDSRIRLRDNKRDLLISNVTDADQGLYLCRAENKKGSAEDSSYVTVGSDITIVAAPVDNRNVTERFRFELDCDATGDPSYEVKYRWLRNGLPLEYSARIHWVKDQHKLLVLDALVSDTGTYTCIAFAETPLYISKRMDVDIVVKAPANPPEIVRIDGNCWGKEAILTWKVGALNNEEIYYFIVEWSTTYQSGHWVALPRVNREDATSTKLDFSLLPPYSQISFRVIAANRIGLSKPSIPTDSSECVTPPSAPPKSPDAIYGVANGRNTLSLVWTPVEQTYWGSAGFNYTVQWRRKTKEKTESRWEFGKAWRHRIDDGNNNSIVILNPGYYNEWEFRIRSNNHLGSAAEWTENTSFSGQDSPADKPTGLEPNSISARSAEISWQKVSAPFNGSIDGYRIEYWHSAIGIAVVYDKTRRSKRDDEEEEEELDMCFDPNTPCTHHATVKESKLDGLMPYKLYHIRISAYNSGGGGPLSDELTFETDEDMPGEPYAVNIYAYGQYAKLTWKEPRHMNGKILNYEVFGKGIVTTLLPWWMRRHIIYNLNFESVYEAKLRARTQSGWGEQALRWFTTTTKQKPAKPLLPEVLGYGEDGVNVTFMEPKPELIRKFGGPIDEDPWEERPVDGFDMEHRGVGGYPEEFLVLYRRTGYDEPFKRTERKRMYSERDQTWIVIENLEMFTLYEFATLPINKQGEGPKSDLAIALPGGIVPQVKKLNWYQRDWFISLAVLFGAAIILFLIIFFSTHHLKGIYYEGAPKRRKDREREKIFEPEDVDGGFNEFTLKSARSSRSVVTSRSEAPPPYSVTNGSASRHSGDFDDDDIDSDEDDEKHEVSTYYSDEKKIPLDDVEEDDEEEDSRFATFV